MNYLPIVFIFLVRLINFNIYRNKGLDRSGNQLNKNGVLSNTGFNPVSVNYRFRS